MVFVSLSVIALDEALNLNEKCFEPCHYQAPFSELTCATLGQAWKNAELCAALCSLCLFNL